MWRVAVRRAPTRTNHIISNFPRIPHYIRITVNFSFIRRFVDKTRRKLGGASRRARGGRSAQLTRVSDATIETHFPYILLTSFILSTRHREKRNFPP